MKPNPAGLASLCRLIDLEVGEERRCFLLKESKTGHGHSPDLQLRPFAQPKLEHRSPRPDIRAHDDLYLGGVGKNTTGRFASHLPTVDLVLNPVVAGHEPLD